MSAKKYYLSKWAGPIFLGNAYYHIFKELIRIVEALQSVMIFFATFFTDPWYDPLSESDLENQQRKDIFSTA